MILHINPVALLASISLILSGTCAFLFASKRANVQHAVDLKAQLKVQHVRNKEQETQIVASTNENQDLQSQLLRLHKRVEDLAADKDNETLILTAEWHSAREQLDDIKERSTQQLREKEIRVLSLTTENERLQRQLEDLRWKYGGLEAKAYATILALANGNSALHRQIEVLGERNDGLEAQLMEAEEVSQVEISRLRHKLRSREQSSLQQTAQLEARIKTIEAAMQAREARAAKEVEDAKGTYAKEVLELRDKLSECHHLLNDGFAGGFDLWSQPQPILLLGRKSKLDELKSTEDLGQSYKAAYSAPERLCSGN